MKKLLLTGKHADGRFALVDDEDFDRASKFSWWFDFKRGYPARSWRVNYTRHNEPLHHFIIPQIPKGMVRDHINRNKLDNRKENLRIVSHSTNITNSNTRSDNTSGFRGINKRGGSYRWFVSFDGKQVHLGSSTDFNEAVKQNKIARLVFYDDIEAAEWLKNSLPEVYNYYQEHKNDTVQLKINDYIEMYENFKQRL